MRRTGNWSLRINKKCCHVYNNAIRKRLTRKELNLRFKELKSYFATYLRSQEILSEYIDLLQGRIPKSVFARHYLKLKDVKELVQKVNAATTTIESSLPS
jgi:intergrase/recombinase